jgi:hypothetical protein
MAYRVSKTDCKTKSKEVVQKDMVDTKGTKEEVAEVKNKKKENAVYTCDFSKIRTAKDLDMKPIKLKNTTYYNKNFNIYAKKADGGFWKVRHSGAEIIILSENYFNKICRKK